MMPEVWKHYEHLMNTGSNIQQLLNVVFQQLMYQINKSSCQLLLMIGSMCVGLYLANNVIVS